MPWFQSIVNARSIAMLSPRLLIMMITFGGLSIATGPVSPRASTALRAVAFILAMLLMRRATHPSNRRRLRETGLRPLTPTESLVGVAIVAVAVILILFLLNSAGVFEELPDE
jgi:ABC-type transport system involved in multi-copper enzyme maturation permease subunit